MSDRFKIPDYFRQKYQLIATVTFTAFFSLVFMLVSIPFSHNVWFELGPSTAFMYTAIFFAIGLLIIILSKRMMYATRSLEMSYLQYVLWDLAEVVVICMLYTVFSLKGDDYGIITLENNSVSRIFLNAFVYCSTFYRYLSGETNTSAEDDNYIMVWYTDSKGELKKYMLRCRLKTVEESFKGSSLVRCHRKYIVNMDKVKVLRKEKDGYEMDLDNDLIPPISITRTYAENVLGILDKREKREN